MDSHGLKDRLLSVIANIEERTDSELISVIKDTLTAVGTGTPIKDVNEQYKFIYRTLDDRLSRTGTGHGNQFDDLWAFHAYWKEQNMDTYASRRTYVRTLYRSESSNNEDPFWSLINPTIKGIAKPRFDNKQYADSVEAVFKEINSRVKEVFRQKTGEDEDGAKLMNKAFSPKSPVIILDDLETEDGTNIQTGYMQIFAGAMTGIRNPKAHSNHGTTAEEAMPLIQLASHLFSVFEQATKNAPETVAKETVESESIPTLFLRLKNPDDHEKLLGIKKITSQAKGNVQVVLVLGENKTSVIRLPMKVDVTNKQLLADMKNLLGDRSVVVKKN